MENKDTTDNIVVFRNKSADTPSEYTDTMNSVIDISNLMSDTCRIPEYMDDFRRNLLWSKERCEAVLGMCALEGIHLSVSDDEIMPTVVQYLCNRLDMDIMGWIPEKYGDGSFMFCYSSPQKKYEMYDIVRNNEDGEVTSSQIAFRKKETLYQCEYDFDENLWVNPECLAEGSGLSRFQKNYLRKKRGTAEEAYLHSIIEAVGYVNDQQFKRMLKRDKDLISFSETDSNVPLFLTLNNYRDENGDPVCGLLPGGLENDMSFITMTDEGPMVTTFLLHEAAYCNLTQNVKNGRVFFRFDPKSTGSDHCIVSMIPVPGHMTFRELRSIYRKMSEKAENLCSGKYPFIPLSLNTFVPGFQACGGHWLPVTEQLKKRESDVLEKHLIENLNEIVGTACIENRSVL